MSFNTLISTAELAENANDDNWAIVDCRFALDDPSRGRADYHKGHIPGAIYAHLDEDLSGTIIPGKTGRHPLPSVVSFAGTLSRWGVDEGVQVVAYDDAGGVFASRLWWLLRWMGHNAVAVLNGGLGCWTDEKRPLLPGQETRAPRRFRPRPRPELVVETAEVLQHMHDPSWRIVDSRTPERYRGEHEPIDPVAGRIPGAYNAPHPECVGPDGRFLSADQLRAHFTPIVEDMPTERVVFYCGSGVSAAQNLLAFAHAGLGDARLYAGSWSEWITDPTRPQARD